MIKQIWLVAVISGFVLGYSIGSKSNKPMRICIKADQKKPQAGATLEWLRDDGATWLLCEVKK